MAAVLVQKWVTLWRFDEEQFTEIARLPNAIGPDGPRFTADGRTLVLFDPYDASTVWDVSVTPPKQREFPSGFHVLSAASLSADRTSLFAWNHDGQLTELNLSGAKIAARRTLTQWSLPQPGLTPTPDGRRLFVFDDSGSSWWLNLADGQRSPAWKFPGRIQHASFARDGRHLLLVNANGTVYVLRL